MIKEVKRGAWSKDEDEFLKENYMNVNIRSLASSLNRSLHSVKNRKRKLNLTMRGKYHNWSPDEIDYLENNFQNKTYKEIAEYLNIKETTVDARARKLGLIKVNKWSEKEEAKLISFISEEKTIREVFDLFNKKFNLNQLYRKADSLGLQFTSQSRWSEEDEDFLRENYLHMEIEDIAKYLNRSRGGVKKKAQLMDVKRRRPKKWEIEEIEILKENLNLTVRELTVILPHRSRNSIEYKLFKLGLECAKHLEPKNHEKEFKCVKCGVFKIYNEDNFKRNLGICVECLSRYSTISKHKRNFGIELNFEKGFKTYSSIEWLEFVLSGRRNKLPREYSFTEKEKFDMIRYVIEEKLKRTCREDIIKTTRKEILDFKLHGVLNSIGASWLEIINMCYPHLNIQPYELTEAPKGYWNEKENADKYLKHYCKKIIEGYNIKDPKKEMPYFFTSAYMRNNENSIIYNCIYLHNHYTSYYQWLNELYPEWNLDPSDFKTFVGIDGDSVLDSASEKTVFDCIYDSLQVKDIKAIGRKRGIEHRFYNKEFGENYYPDFVIENAVDKPIYIEYYGLYNEKSDHEIFRSYVKKTRRKNEFYKNNNDINFVDLYPTDLNNHCDGVKSKLASFLLQKIT